MLHLPFRDVPLKKFPIVSFTSRFVPAVDRGWSLKSGRKMSGTSRPSLGHEVCALFSFISLGLLSFPRPKGKPQFKKNLGIHLKVPEIFPPESETPATRLQLPCVQMALQTAKNYFRNNLAFHSRYRYTKIRIAEKGG